MNLQNLFSKTLGIGLVFFLSLTTVWAAAPPLPTFTGKTVFCIGSSTVLTAVNTPSNVNFGYRWYRENALGVKVLAFTGNPYTTQVYLLPGTYKIYLEAYNKLDNLKAAQVQIDIVVNSPLNLDVPVGTPSDLTICAGDSTIYTATSITGNNTFNWFIGPIGGNPVFTGNPYQTGALNVVPSLYLSSLNAGGCESPRIAALPLVVTPALDVPLVNPLVSTICNGDSVTLTASALLGGAQFVWYDTITGGTPLFTGAVFNTGKISNNGALNLVKTFYVETVDAAGCRSLRTPALITILPALDVPLVNPIATTACNGQEVTFTASALLGATTFKWYDALNGGTLLFTGNPFKVTPQNNGALQLTNIYYVEATDANGCTSLRTPATVISLPVIDLPLVDPLVATACAGDSVTFNASALLGNNRYFWYDALTGGNLLDSGATFNTGKLNNGSALELTRIFYVETRDLNGCSSLRAPATVISLPLLAVPLANPLVDTVCNGGVATFTASSLLGGTTFNWYENIADANPVATGANFTTPPITNASGLNLVKQYFVEVEDANGCKSLRTPVTIVILPALDVPLATPLAATVCSGQSATFTATSLLGAVNFNWYDVVIAGTPLATGTTFITPQQDNTSALSLTQLYYLEAVDANGCKSLRTPLTVVVTPALDVPIVDPLIDTICNGGSVTLTASSLLGTAASFKWYNTLIGDTAIFTGNPFVSGPITNNNVSELAKLYYAEAIDANGCKSLRTPATIVVLPNIDVPLVNPPVTTICAGDSVTFTASTLLGTEDHFEWYTNEFGGTKLFEGNPFNTGKITNAGTLDLTKTYYVEAVTADGCKSLRIPAIALVTPALDLPLVNPLIDTICAGNRAEFTASTLLGTAVTYNWYDALLGGQLIFTGDTFRTDPLSNQSAIDLVKLFYVEAVNNDGCTSIRTPATVLIRPALGVPLVNPLIDTICNGTSAEFTATTLLIPGASYRWYDQLSGGTLLFEGDTFNTGPISNSTGLDLAKIFFVEGIDAGGCSTIRTPATVLVTPAIDVPLVNPLIDSICSGLSAEFTATTLLGTATSYNWYDSLLATTPVFTGDTFNTGPLMSQNSADLIRIYYVEAVNAQGCTTLRTLATVLLAPALDLPLVNPPLANVCSGGTAQFTATSLLSANPKFNWYDGLLGGNLLFTGDTFTTPTVNNQGTTDLITNYYVEVENELGCKSLRLPVVVTTLPAINAAIALPPVDLVCNGQTSTFVAQALLPGNNTFNWYDDLLAGNLIFSGDTFTTDTISNPGLTDLTRIFYLEVQDSAGCTSLRTPVTQVIRPALVVPIANPLIDTVCNGGITEYTATALLGGNVTFNWYDGLLGDNLIFTGDTFRTSPATNTTALDLLNLYYVEAIDSAGCRSLKTPVTQLVLPALDVPLVNPLIATACSGQAVTFTASSLLGTATKFNWYTNLVGGAPIFTGDTFTVDTLTNEELLDLTRIFYVEAETATGCRSLRTPATIIIRPALTVPVVLPPLDIVCNGQSANYSATALLSPNATFNWYDNLMGGTLLFTGPDFTSEPLINSTTLDLTRTFYVEAVDTSGCKSIRLPVVAIIRPALDVPLVNPLIDTICSGNSAILTASTLLNGEGTFNWYNDLTGGTPIFSGDTFTTPVIENGTGLELIKLFYVEFVDTAGCTSLRTPATLVVLPAIDVPLVTPLIQTICNGTSASFKATSILGSATKFNWYDGLTSNRILFTGDSFTSEALFNNGLTDLTVIYYVEGVNAAGCKTVRTPATVVITPNLDIILLNAERTTICAGERATIVATSVLQSPTIRWYLQEVGGDVIFEGETFVSDVLTDTTTFFAASENQAGCESTRAKIKIFVNPTDQLEAPSLDCLPQSDENKVGFTWNAVNGADEYEVSTDGGKTWKLPSAGPRAKQHIETRNDGNQKGISLSVRAIETNNFCAPREGKVSIAKFCTFGTGVDPNNFIIYNSFSPNGDGKNDAWFVADGIENYEDNEVLVFNRWGQKVFGANGYDNKKKQFTGAGLDDGAYFYIVKIPSLNIERTGYVMIIR